ncbi:J domain-containing protein [Desulfobacca acetoxidans]|nr:J domain-containing protein [Desulfobacca acetoxidans]
MPTAPKCYRLLGVSSKASVAEIRRRFRLLALKFHPDRNPHNLEATARFRELADAYAAICAQRRAQVASTPEEKERPGVYSDNGNVRPESFTKADMAAFFGFEDRLQYCGSHTGPDFRYDLQISFAAAIWGIEQEIEFQRLAPCKTCQATGLRPGSYYQSCSACKGRGRLWASPGQLSIGAVCQVCQGLGQIITHPCPQCLGEGYTQTSQRYRIVIPPGTEDGDRIMIAGQGGEGSRQGTPGRLVVVVHVEPDSFFTRKGQDLYGCLDVSFAQAATGGMIEIPTLFGSTAFDLPRGALSGQTFLFPGLGAPGWGGRQPGDLIIKIQISNRPRAPQTDAAHESYRKRREINE